MMELTPNVDEIRRIAGPVSDAQISEILALAPSVEDIEVAVFWVNRQDELGETGHPLAGKAAQIFDILIADEEEDRR